MNRYFNSSIIKIFILTALVFSILVGSAKAIPLEEKLKQQNDTLDNSINANDILPDFYTQQYEELNNYSSERTIDLGSILMNLVKKFTIEGRNFVISLYALYVSIMIIYLSIFGSRDLAKRKSGIVALIIISIMFLLYINIPLILLYIQGDKSLTMQITFTDRIDSIVSFLQGNSFIISALVCYVGITKLIISKNDLSFKLQGRYLVKFSAILLILLNTIPLIIKFII